MIDSMAQVQQTRHKNRFIWRDYWNRARFNAPVGLPRPFPMSHETAPMGHYVPDDGCEAALSSESEPHEFFAGLCVPLADQVLLSNGKNSRS